MSNNLYFETTNALFTRAQALIWIANGLSQLDLFEKSAGKLLSKIIDKCPEDKTLLINFKGVVRFDDYCFSEVYDSLKGNKKQLVILNGSHLFIELENQKAGKQINISNDATNNLIILGDSRTVNINNLKGEKKIRISSYISNVLKSTFSKYEDFKRLCSTPFLANGEFDSKKIIESPKDFMWISFYLSDKLLEIIESEKLTNIVLVSASLRGAAFTSILGILNDLEYINIDHVGPIHRVYDFDFLDLKHRDKNYIYIGDFVFGEPK